MFTTQLEGIETLYQLYNVWAEVETRDSGWNAAESRAALKAYEDALAKFTGQFGEPEYEEGCGLSGRRRPALGNVLHMPRKTTANRDMLTNPATRQERFDDSIQRIADTAGRCIAAIQALQVVEDEELSEGAGI